MMTCKQIKRLIDEADRPDVLSFEAAGHVASCVSCREFARDRASLRELLASGTRVSVPVNFDATLQTRLAAATGRNSFSWFSPAFYLRFAGASAAIIVAIFVAQYNGLIFGPDEAGKKEVVAVDTNSAAPANPATVASTTRREAMNAGDTGRLPAHQMTAHRHSTAIPSVRVARVEERRVRSFESSATVAGRDLRAADGAVVLVRGRNGDLEVPVPTVSVGAQPLVYVNMGGQAPRNVRASF